jgi:hypothetical protein
MMEIVLTLFCIKRPPEETIISSGFVVNSGRNEIQYNFVDDVTTTLYWSLPPEFTGNLLTSYGGNLTWSQMYRLRPNNIDDSDVETEVQVYGNGIKLFWALPIRRQFPFESSGQEKRHSVRFVPSEWKRIDRQQSVTASRVDMLMALSNVETILIRATFSPYTASVMLKDVSMDTAIPQFTGRPMAIDVEQCRCPEGYIGLSCEV